MTRDQRQRLRRQVRQRQRLGLGAAPTGCSPRRILRMGVPVAARNIFPSNIQGLPTWYEVRVCGGGLSRPARRRRPDGRDEPADLGPGRRRRSSRAATCSTIPPSRCRRRSFRERHQRHRHAADRDLQRALPGRRASASCSRTSSTSARSPTLLGIELAEVERADRRAVQGQGQADRAQHRGAAHGPRLRREHLGCPMPAQGAARRRGRRPHLHRRQRRRGAGRGLRRRDGVRLVPDHAVDLAGGGVRQLLPQVPRRSARRQEPLRHRPGRGRARRRSAW